MAVVPPGPVAPAHGRVDVVLADVPGANQAVQVVPPGDGVRERATVGLPLLPPMDPRRTLAPGARASLNAQARVPVEPTSPGLASKVATRIRDFVMGEPNVPNLPVKKRLMAAYGGMAPLVSAYAPQQLDSYHQLLLRTMDATDVKQLADDEAQLKALKTSLMASVKSTLADEQALAAAQGRPFDRLATLEAKGFVSASWTMPAPGRLVKTTVPEDGDEQVQRAKLYNVNVPIEAEMILDTRMPIAAVNRDGMGVTVFRGEDYGTQRGLDAAQGELAARTAERQAALLKEKGIRAEIAQANDDINTGTAQLRAQDAAIAAAAARVTQTTDEAQRTATIAAAATADADAATRTAQTRRDASADEIKRALMRLDKGIDLTILFASDRADLKPESTRQLDELAAALKSDALEGLKIFVDGHTDAHGTVAHNQTLSEKRAQAVVAYLVAHGVAPDLLSARGMGKSQIKDPAHDEVNRRVQVSVDTSAVSAERKAELEAKAAEDQVALETIAAQKAQTAADAATAASTAQDADVVARKALVDARQARAATAAAINAAIERVRRGEAALPLAGHDVAKADTGLASAQRAVDKAVPLAEGAFFVNDVGSNHFWFEDAPKDLPGRIDQALMRGFADQGTQGNEVRDLFRLRNAKTNRTLGRDIATTLEQNENDRGWWPTLRERVHDLGVSGRWITIGGYYGAGDHMLMSQPVPDTVTPPPEVIVPVELVMEPAPAVLGTTNQVSTGATAGAPAPEPTNNASAISQAPQPAAIDTSPTTPVPNVDAAADAARRAEAQRLEARARLDAAKRRVQTTQAAASESRATAAQMRAALTQRATHASIDLQINFAYKSAKIDDPTLLIELGRALSSPELKGKRILLDGHTDADGTAELNRTLSLQRAQAVREFLVTRFGLSPDLLIVRGFGFERLKNPNDPRAAENRRVEITVQQ